MMMGVGWDWGQVKMVGKRVDKGFSPRSYSFLKGEQVRLYIGERGEWGRLLETRKGGLSQGGLIAGGCFAKCASW